MVLKLRWMLLILSLFAGCAQPTQLPQTIPPSPTKIVTAKPLPTNTVVPIAPPATAALAPEVSPSPTAEPTTAALIAALRSKVQPRSLGVIESPDGQWRAEVNVYDCAKVTPGEDVENAYDVLTIIRASDGQTFTPAEQILYCGGLGAFGLGGINWSPNSRYFYYTDAREGIPDGQVGAWKRPVYRFDTQTGQTTALGGGAMSPDGSKLAYVVYSSTKPCLPDHWLIETTGGDTIARYSLDQPACDNPWYSDKAWSPDSQSLVYVMTLCASGKCPSNVTLRTIDQPEARNQLLAQEDAGFVSVAWSDPDRLVLTDLKGMRWLFTISTGDLLQVQP